MKFLLNRRGTGPSPLIVLVPGNLGQAAQQFNNVSFLQYNTLDVALGPMAATDLIRSYPRHSVNASCTRERKEEGLLDK